MYRIPINAMQFPDILKGPSPTSCQVASALTLLYAQNASTSGVPNSIQRQEPHKQYNYIMIAIVIIIYNNNDDNNNINIIILL